MNSGSENHLEDVLVNMSVGVALLDATNFCIRYANAYLHSLLVTLWQQEEINGQQITEILPESLHSIILPLLRQAATTQTKIELAEIPFEGFLEIRGRTYWRISIEYRAPTSVQIEQGAQSNSILLVTIEDITEAVRARLHIQAVHAISSALAGPASLPLILERILHVLQEIFGSKRCAVFLLDNSVPTFETHVDELKNTRMDIGQLTQGPQTAHIVAQSGLHPVSHQWQVLIDEHMLLGLVARERRTRIITDTSTTPQAIFPYLEHLGEPHRPGSVLCVPIFEPQINDSVSLATDGKQHTVLGMIEVYHLRARGFPAEEVSLLEQFAQQAGLAIQNARLFRHIDRLARTASRNARQKENIMQSIPDGVVIVDSRWRIADINQAARDLMGWDDRIITTNLLEALKRSQAVFQYDLLTNSNTIEALEQRASQGPRDEFKMTGANGCAYSMQTTYAPIRDELGDIFAFIVIYHDITQQVADRERIEAEVVARTAEIKQRNLALQEAQENQAITNARMSLLLERLPIGVILVTAVDNHITIINRQAVELLQKMGAQLAFTHDLEEASQQVIDQDYEQILRAIPMYNLSGALLPYHENPFYTALRLGESSEAEIYIVRNDGQSLYLLVNAAPLRASDGSIESAIIVYQDITRIKILERTREDFFTTMAHELKTPLANIRAHLSALLARDLHLSLEEQYDYLQTADQQVDRLVGMINHFLDASRIEAGALRLELEPILLPELLEDVQERLEALILSTHCTLHIDIPEPLPAIRGDYELVLSVLINLLSNAFRYTPEGDAVQLRVELISDAPKQRPQSVKISVIDKGPGINKEQRGTLFTRFSTFAALKRPSNNQPGQQELVHRQKTTRWSPATGLGLYISRGIIEAHGSQLELTSSPGNGATFAFTLPIFRGKRRQMRSTTAPTAIHSEGV